MLSTPTVWTLEKKFDSSSIPLSQIMADAAAGRIQLPDFQRGWVWDDDHIRSLVASISVSYPIGAVMTLATGNPDVRFKPRVIEGVELNGHVEPDYLLLDGQQRATSLFLALHSPKPVPTRDSRGKEVLVHYYADINMCLDPSADRDDAIVSVPQNRVQTFRNEIILDVSSAQMEYDAEMFPLDIVLDQIATMNWGFGYMEHGPGEHADRVRKWQEFSVGVVTAFVSYQVPTIQLAKSTPKDAVCQVFEKVNTGGVSLTVFELLTATFAVDGFNLREDWDERAVQLQYHPVLGRFGSTDFLQAITLLTTFERRLDSIASGTSERTPAVSGTRKEMLRLTLSDYQYWADKVTASLEQVARFLHGQHIYTAANLPYTSQVVPLAAIFARLDGKPLTARNADQLRRWFWNGIFGEMYGGATETRFANDLIDLDQWLFRDSVDEPRTIREAQFQAERLLSLRSRSSAAYKGLFALQMKTGALDFRTGTPIDASVYFDDAIDIHHIFPRAWSDKNGVESSIADCAVNKTPIDAHTNRYIGGSAPSAYLNKIQEDDGIAPEKLDEIIRSHGIDPSSMRDDDFRRFFNQRFETIVRQIGAVMGKPVNRSDGLDESPFVEVGDESDAIDLVRLIAQGENDKVEFKSTARINTFTNQADPKIEWSALKTIAGFANNDGGTLVVGVNDDGQAVGLETDYSTFRKQDRDGWELWLTDAVSATMGKVAALLLKVRFVELEGKNVAIVEVRPSEAGPVFAAMSKGDDQKQRFMVRVNNSTQELDGREADDYKRVRWPNR